MYKNVHIDILHAKNLDCGGFFGWFLSDVVIIALCYFSVLYYAKPSSELEKLWSVPGCLLLSFYNVIFILLASLPFHAWVPARRWQRGPGAQQLQPLAIVGPGTRREETACLFSSSRVRILECVFCILFLGLVSLGSVFPWLTAGIAFLMLRSWIHVFIDSVRCCILEQK